MKHKIMLACSMLFILIVTATCSLPPTEDVPVPDEARLYVDCLTLSPGSDETQLTVSWHSHDKTGLVFVREDGSEAEFEVDSKSILVNEAFGYTHKATVTNLMSNTTYLYKISNGVAVSLEYDITIGDTARYSFFVVGDPQIIDPDSDAQKWENTINRAVAAFPEASFMISCGDQVDGTGDVEVQYAAYLSPLGLRSLLVAQTMGNHDVLDTAAYANHFNMPNYRAFGTIFESVRNQGDYWFTYGSSLFMVLDSNITSIMQHKNFMEKAIDSNPDCLWKIAIFHDPIYSEGDHHDDFYQLIQRDTWTPVIDSLGIDVVFSGHDHTYCRTHPMRGNKATQNGTVYFSLNSSSGSKYYDFANLMKAPYTAFRSQNYRPQFTKVDVTDYGLTITTYEVMDDGELNQIDSYIISKPK